MGQSLVKNYVHIVFSTKHRQPFIQQRFESQLYSYMAGICNRLECTPLQVGGHLDHVHIACRLSQKLALMKLLEEIKSHSSKWFKTVDRSLENFFWQDGYGAFSVNPHEIEIVRRYIRNQHAHHNKMGFKTEFRGYLKKYNIEYDEKYVWD